MKLKHWILILVAGVLIGLVGSWMKIVHWLHADAVLAVSMVVKVIAIVFIGAKVIRNPKLRDIMNS